MKKIVAGFLILGLIFPSPAYSMRAKATANARNGLRLDFIGDLLKMGAAQKPPVLIRSEYRAHNPYASGVVPSEEIVAKPRPVRFAADRIAAGVFARGLIGIGDPDQVDLTAQDISDRAYHSQGLDVEYMGMEGGKHGVYTTGYVQSGAHQAGSRISVPGSKGVIRVYADVTEGTDMIMSGNQDVGGSGGQSMAIDGSLADVFGVLFDDLGAEMMVGRVPLDQMKNFLPIQGGQALDPSNPVESAQRLLAANGITWKDAQAFYQRRKRSIKSVLEPLQSQPGLTVTQIQNGTVDAALLAMLGRKTGKYVFTAGTAGSTEAASNYLEALAMEGVVVSFRILSPLAKAVADELGSLDITLAELDAAQVAMVKQKGKLTEADYAKLRKDVPIKFVFPPQIVERIKQVRPFDWQEITSPEGKLFNNETITYPKAAGDTLAVDLRDGQGTVINSIPVSSHEERMLTAAHPFLVGSRILGVADPVELEPGKYQVQHLILERDGSNSRAWVSPSEILWSELVAIAPDLFVGEPPPLALSKNNLIAKLNSPNQKDRLLALSLLLKAEKDGLAIPELEPSLESFFHVHTKVSYGNQVPGVHSPTYMIWQAHREHRRVIAIVEHESIAHLEEAELAIALVNDGIAPNDQLKFIGGVEFKASILDLDGEGADELRAGMYENYGQSDSAWILGLGAKNSTELRNLVKIFQAAKLERARLQLQWLNIHLHLKLTVEQITTPEGNITDRSLAFAVAAAKLGSGASPSEIAAEAGIIRKMLNPGGPAFVPFPKELPSYEEVTAKLAKLGMVTVFTSQVKGPQLKPVMPLIKRLKIRALDTAGIEPNDPEAQNQIQTLLKLAEENKLLTVGGTDFRGLGTGWGPQHDNRWMTHAQIVESTGQVLAMPASEMRKVSRSEMRRMPAIGYLTPVQGLDSLSAGLVRGEGWANAQAINLLGDAALSIETERHHRTTGAPVRDLYEKFNEIFGTLLRLTQGNMTVFGDVFVATVNDLRRRSGDSTADELIEAVKNLAQDSGAPFTTPPLSYYNPARYVYSRLQQEAVDGFNTQVLADVVADIRQNVIETGVALDDVKAKSKAVTGLQQRLGQGRQTKGSYQYEIFYDSLVQKDGEYYIAVQVLIGPSELHQQGAAIESKQGAVLELLVSIPAAEQSVQYQNPYLLIQTEGYEVGILDAIHYINDRFPEWRPTAQRDIYASRVEALRQTGVKRQYLRPSARQGHNPRFFEPFLKEYLVEDVPFSYHIVHTRSERDYANVTGVTAVASLATAIAIRGGLGVTASWYLENPTEAEPLIGRNLIYSFEIDHHRMDDTQNIRALGKNLAYFLGAYQEAVATGWASANLQDETVFINQKMRNVLIALEHIAKTHKIDEKELAEKFKKFKKDNDFTLERVYQVLEAILNETNRDSILAVVEKIRETGEIDPDIVFRLLQEIYHGSQTVGEGIPNALDVHWMRAAYLKNLVNTVGREAGMTAFDQYYVEPDYALDAQPQTMEEFMYLTLMEWIQSQASGYPFGPGVPSYGNVHGASAGDPNLALLGVFQYAAQTTTAFANDIPANILEIARKAPREAAEKLLAMVNQFQPGEEEERARVKELLKLVASTPERTEAEEQTLRAYVHNELTRIAVEHPNDFNALKEAERQGKPLGQVSRRSKRRLDASFKDLPLNRRAWVTTHAASGLAKSQIRQAKNYGVIFANKSTEFQNVIFKILQLVASMNTDRDAAERALKAIPGMAKVLRKNPLTQADIDQAAKLYNAMYDAAFKFARREGKEEVKYHTNRVFPYFWGRGGWSTVDGEGTDWAKIGYKWAPGNYGRYGWSMRDSMVTGSPDQRLLFPNALSWDIPQPVILMAQAAIRGTIQFYQRASVMNAVGGAEEVRDYLERQARQAVASVAGSLDQQNDFQPAANSEMRDQAAAIAAEFPASLPVVRSEIRHNILRTKVPSYTASSVLIIEGPEDLAYLALLGTLFTAPVNGVVSPSPEVREQVAAYAKLYNLDIVTGETIAEVNRGVKKRLLAREVSPAALQIRGYVTENTAKSLWAELIRELGKESMVARIFNEDLNRWKDALGIDAIINPLRRMAEAFSAAA